MLTLFRASLFFQVLGWISVSGAVVVLLIFLLIKRELGMATSETALAHAHTVYEAFVIGAEQGNTLSNRARLVQSLSQSEEINHIFLIDDQGNVDVSSSRQYWNKSIFDLPIISSRSLDKDNEINVPNHINFIEGANGYEFISFVMLSNPNGIGFEQYALIIQLSESNVSSILNEMKNEILFLMASGYFVTLFLIYLVCQVYLQTPIKKATRIVLKSSVDGERRMIEHRLTNQLGLLFDAYNSAQKNIIENQKQLKRAIAKEIKASRAKSEFLANMSHELRTPLNSIIGFTKRLIRKLENDQTFKYSDILNIILHNGEYLLSLINDVLDLSKISAGKMTLQIKMCNIESLISECIGSVSELANQKNIQIIKPSTYQVKEIEADPLRLKQIFLNLINNAIKYTDAGSVRLSILKDDQPGWVRIDVQDTGQGIRQEDQERLFHRFEQFDEIKTTKIGQGTGLGLSLVYEFVRMHGGRISVESQYGEGSRFSVHLPVHQSPF